MKTFKFMDLRVPPSCPNLEARILLTACRSQGDEPKIKKNSDTKLWSSVLTVVTRVNWLPKMTAFGVAATLVIASVAMYYKQQDQPLTRWEVAQFINNHSAQQLAVPSLDALILSEF